MKQCIGSWQLVELWCTRKSSQKDSKTGPEKSYTPSLVCKLVWPYRRGEVLPVNLTCFGHACLQYIYRGVVGAVMEPEK